MINTRDDFIADWNKNAMARPYSAPLPDNGRGDYRLPYWDWSSLIWKKIKRRVFNLQKRIYKATKEGHFKKARSLTKLLNRSRCAVLLGVRKVTQDNRGAKTPGIDGRRARTPEARKRLAERLMDWAQQTWNGYKAKPTKRVFIKEWLAKRGL